MNWPYEHNAREREREKQKTIDQFDDTKGNLIEAPLIGAPLKHCGPRKDELPRDISSLHCIVS